MAKTSAGILMYRWNGDQPELFLAHPGGPFWAKKDDGAWSIPKGLCEGNEDPLVTAQREFEEETGHSPSGNFEELGSFKQPSGKVILAWGIEDQFDLAEFKSNQFQMEWPPKSGKMREFPEIDRVEWFDINTAMRKILKGQQPIISKLIERLGVDISALKETTSPVFDHSGQGSLF